MCFSSSFFFLGGNCADTPYVIPVLIYVNIQLMVSSTEEIYHYCDGQKYNLYLLSLIEVVFVYFLKIDFMGVDINIFGWVLIRTVIIPNVI